MSRESLVQIFGALITLATVVVTLFAILHIFAG